MTILRRLDDSGIVRSPNMNNERGTLLFIYVRRRRDGARHRNFRGAARTVRVAVATCRLLFGFQSGKLLARTGASDGLFAGQIRRGGRPTWRHSWVTGRLVSAVPTGL